MGVPGSQGPLGKTTEEIRELGLHAGKVQGLSGVGETDRLAERAIEKIGKESENGTATESERGRKEIEVRGTRTGKGRGNEKETERGSGSGRETGIAMGDETVETGIVGMRGTGRNVLQLESLPGSRGTRVGSLSGTPARPHLQRRLRHPADLQMPHPDIGRLPKEKTVWVSDADLLTMILIAPPNGALVRIVLTMRSGPAEVVVGMVRVLMDRPMNDLGNLKGVAGARRNPRKSSQKRRFQRVQRP